MDEQQTVLTRLNHGVEAWNEWRKTSPNTRPDLSELVLSKNTLEQLPILENGNVDLRGINLTNTNLRKTKFEKLDMTNADFSNSQIQDADFQQIVAHRACFDSADLSQTKFWELNAIESSFWDANLEHVVLSEAHLQKANFYGAILHEANLEGAHLDHVEMWMTVLDDANLDGASFQHAHLVNGSFQRAIMTQVDLRYANLNAASLCDADLSSSDVRGSDLRWANLSRVNLSGTQFDKKGKYRGIRLDGCYGGPHFLRIARDQDFIEELQEQQKDPFKPLRKKWGWKILNPIPTGRWVFWLWSGSSDCGRSIVRWMIFSFLLSILFGLILYSLGPESFYISNSEKIDFDWSLWLMFCYSMSIFCKVNIGIQPITDIASYWVILTGLTGLLMLGGVITILADKVARRT